VLALVLVATGCRQALGIPGQFDTPGCGEIGACYTVSGRVIAIHPTSEPVAIDLGDLESITPTADGEFTFAYGIKDLDGDGDVQAGTADNMSAMGNRNYIMVGDWNHDGIAGADENVLVISRQDAFALLDYQTQLILRPLFGWMRQDGTRRFRKAYIEIPKKNGKTQRIAGLALYMLLAEQEPGAEVYVPAAARDQARIPVSAAVELAAISTSTQILLLGGFALVSGVLLLAFALNVKGWREVLGSPAVAL
jgi:hypothetical protein